MDNAFVHIVESPSNYDFLDGRTEGRALTGMLEIAGVPNWYSVATDLETFKLSLDGRLAQALDCHDKNPIIHLSMHGNEHEIGFTGGERIDWNELRSILLPIVRGMRGGLIICMSSCFGSAGCRMAMHTDPEHTFHALIGSRTTMPVSDAALAYASFYNLLFKGCPLETCVASMQVASGNHSFQLHYGSETRQNYIDYFNAETLRRMQDAVGI